MTYQIHFFSPDDQVAFHYAIPSSKASSTQTRVGFKYSYLARGVTSDTSGLFTAPSEGIYALYFNIGQILKLNVNIFTFMYTKEPIRHRLSLKGCAKSHTWVDKNNYARTVFGDMFVVAHLKKYEQVWLSTLCYDGIVSLDAQSSFSGFLIDRL